MSERFTVSEVNSEL